MDKFVILKKMLEIDKENANAWYLLGVEYIECCRESEAITAFSEALKFCDENLRSNIYEQISKLSINKSKIEISNEEFDGDGEEIEEEYEKEDCNNEIFRVIRGGKEDSDVDYVEKNKNSTTFSDIGGCEELKETIRMKIIKPFTCPGIFEKFKKKVGGGILLYGPPGCGKTFIAKATAGECRARFMPISISDILNPYIGVSEENMRDVFATARSSKPAILFFDEIDTIGYNRSKLSSEHLRGVIDEFLSQVDGIESNTDKILIIGATNTPWDVDPAFKRPGRFDRLIFVAPPDKAARKEIFKLKLKDRPAENLDYDKLAEETELFSGADIESIVETSIEYVIDDIIKTGIERNITMSDMLKAIHNSRATTIDWLKTIKNYVKYANQSGMYNDVERYIDKHKKLI